jgi:hypothetical protein
MEKFNLNEGNDALKRVLLMMKYDTNKTLSENVEEIKEQYVAPAVGATAVGAGLGAGATAAGVLPGTAVVGAGTTGGAMTVGVTGVGAAAEAVGSALGIGLAGGAAVLGGAAALAVVPLAYWLITKDTGSKKVKKMFEMCSTDASKIAKLPRKLTDNDFRSMTDDIGDAIVNDSYGFQGGTDEEKLFGTFKKLESGTASDFCALVKYYNTHSDSGDLFDDLDSDIDSESEWKQIYRPIRNCVEDSLLSIKDDKKGKDLIKTGGGKTPGPTPGRCPAVTNTGVSYDYKYPRDTKYVYGVKDKEWYAKNVTNGKEFNISKCYPDMVKKLNSGATKSTSPTPSPTPTPSPDDVIDNTQDNVDGQNGL